MTRRPLRVIGYVRLSPEEALADPIAVASHDDQQAELRSWAEAHGATLVEILVDRTTPDLDAISHRVAFANALMRIRDGEADAMCVAALDCLADDVIVQELLLAEARLAHVNVLSASRADDAALAEAPADPRRRLIRDVLAQAPEFQGQMRSLRARVRRAQTLAELELSNAALVRIEGMEERGATGHDILAMLGVTTSPRRPRRLRDVMRGLLTR